MSAVALGVAWGGLVVGWAARRRPPSPRRLLALRGTAAVSPLARVLPTPRVLAAWLGVAIAAGAVFPPAGLAVLGAAVVRPVLRQRGQRRQAGVAVERDLSDVVALLGLAVASGTNLLGALSVAAQYSDGPVAVWLRGAAIAVRRGARLADVLDGLPLELGESTRPFAAALVSCDRYGAPLGPTLDRLGADVRTATRQRAEAAARRLPIRLLFPLISCILPAFALLTVAPLIAGSLLGLRL